ncbi:hypothetical protein AB0F72_08940 [Actinoplanes sp. NPDC023936]|uniref:hypothetical protein n=1 Tax=Actinoplanes sp. NPDC023936 TaxID=3154910 RepID=UPI0033E00F13
MTSHVAAIATQPDVVTGDVCDLSIATAEVLSYRNGDYNPDTGQYDEIPEYTMSTNIVFTADLTVHVDDDDKLAKAEDEADQMLAKNGWSRTSDWFIADTAMYADVEPA